MAETATYNPKRAQRSAMLRLHRWSWLIVNQTLFRFSPFFCYGWRRFLLRCFGAKIAKTATIARSALIEQPWNLSVGENAMVCRSAWLLCTAAVEIGDNSIIGEFARVLTGSHVSNSKSYRGISSSVIIGKDCWIATGAIVSSGGYRKLKIGDGAVIGVGAVVLSSVKPMAIMVGNPAKFIVEREFNKD